MRIVLNGVETETVAGTVQDLLGEVLNAAATDGVAVAIGGEVVRRGEWALRGVCEGDCVEVIRAVGGG